MPQRRSRPPRSGALTDLPPLKIIKKIVLLQLSFYACATSLILFTCVVTGTAFSPSLIFSWDSLRGDTTLGWILGLVWMLNSFLCVIFLLIIVSRSKLVPDFTLTTHSIHVVIVALYTRSVPTNLLWWSLQFASSALMTFIGIWACQYRELKPISFGGLVGSSSAANTTDSNSQPGDPSSQDPQVGDANKEPESGHQFLSSSRGRGRGRNRDASDDYEMVTMKDVEEGVV